MRHIHISAIDCDARGYDAAKHSYTCKRSVDGTCDFDTCMSCKRSRQWLDEQRLRKEPENVKILRLAQDAFVRC